MQGINSFTTVESRRLRCTIAAQDIVALAAEEAVGPRSSSENVVTIATI